MAARAGGSFCGTAEAEKRMLQLENLFGYPPVADGPCLKLSLDYEEVSRIFRFLEGSTRLWLFSYVPGEWRHACPAAASGTAYDQPVYAPAYVTEVGLVAPIEFGNGASRVADFTKGFAHRRPVHVAVAQVHPVIAIFFALKVFQVDLRNALPQGANPILRIAVKHHIPNVEPRLDPWTLEFPNVGSHLQRT